MEDNCECCKAAIDNRHILIKLEGGWTLNHFGGKEKYLGRLLLQTQIHRPDWGDLSLEEIKIIGEHIQRISSSLRRYWIQQYNDPIEQIYVVYLNDKPYKNYISDEGSREIDKELHVHLHLLPRTKETRECLNKHKNDALGWHLVDYIYLFPPQYKITDNYEPEVMALTDYLRKSLTTKCK